MSALIVADHEHPQTAARAPALCCDFPINRMSSERQLHSLGLLRRTNGASYIPGPAPNAAGNEDDDVKMGVLSVLKVGQPGGSCGHC